MKFKRLVDSFNHAINGVIDTARSEKNMRIHIIAAIIVLIACCFFNITKTEFLILVVTICVVIAAELLNTAIETVIDMTTNYYHPLAKKAKNAAAGGVFVTAVGAIIVGYIIFWDKLANISYDVVYKVKNSDPFTVLIVLCVVSLVTVITKAIYGEGTPLKGGMPSGHSALSFSMATIIALITLNPTCILVSYIMALITAQSRVDAEVHTVLEVIVGGVMGTLITTFIFTLFNI